MNSADSASTSPSSLKPNPQPDSSHPTMETANTEVLSAGRIPDRASLEATYKLAYPLYQYALLVIEQRLRACFEQGSVHPSIKGRIKGFSSLYAKIIRVKKEARLDGTDPIPITDVLAVRVICPFLGDLQEAEYLIRKNFDVVEFERKGSERSFREFGYESIHMLATIPKDLLDAVTGLEKPVFEIQLRTILQEAWAEVEHELVYKAEFTPFDEPLKRKLAALNATLSLSDIIFQEILDYQRRLNTELDRRRGNFYGKIEETMDRPLALTGRAPLLEPALPDPLQGDSGFASPTKAVIGVRENSEESIFSSLKEMIPTSPPFASRTRSESSITSTLPDASGDPTSPSGHDFSGMNPVDDPEKSIDTRFRTLDELLLSALEAHNRNDFETAVEDYTRILDRNPVEEIASVVYKHRGMAFFSQSRYDLALKDFGTSLELDPGCYKSAYYRGVVRSVLQDYPGAITDFNTALDIHPYHFWSRYRRAMAFFQIQDFPQALSDCEAALKLEPSNSLAQGLRDMARSKIRF